MHMFTAAFRTLDLALFVFRKSEDGFERFLAIFAEEFVTRHGGDPQSRLPHSHFTAPEAGYAGEENSRPTSQRIQSREVDSSQFS